MTDLANAPGMTVAIDGTGYAWQKDHTLDYWWSLGEGKLARDLPQPAQVIYEPAPAGSSTKDADA